MFVPPKIFFQSSFIIVGEARLVCKNNFVSFSSKSAKRQLSSSMYYFSLSFQVSPASLGEPRQISNKVRENKKRWLGCESRIFWLLSIIFASFTAELQRLPK
jgi:hypothetical protein